MKSFARLCFIVPWCSFIVVAALPAHAQTNSCFGYYDYIWDLSYAPPAPSGVYDGVGQGPFWVKYKIRGLTCAPPTAANETCPTCPSAGHPISLATGNTYIEQSDIRIPGLGGGLALTRTWNSKWPASQNAYQNTGMFGPNWRSNYEERIYVDGNDHYVRYLRGNGSFWSFGYSSKDPNAYIFNYALVAPASEIATLSEDKSANQWTLTLHNGEKRIFDRPDAPAAGKLLSIVDRNGNTTQLTYDGANRLTTVTDAAGRHLYFGYGTGDQYYLVTSVTSDPAAGIAWTYAYEANNPPRLTRITKPDSTYITFEYESHSLISAVKDMNGKILEAHTYDDFGRGLSSSRANGVDAVTISYPTQ